MEDDILLRKIADVSKLCEKYHTPRFSDFLDEREVAIIKQNNVSGVLFGGYEDADRCIFGAFPEWMEADFEEFPISVLRFTKKFPKELNHRHFLGTVLSLGIERSRVGDILVGDKESYVFLSDNISQYVMDGITKIAGCGVDIDKVHPSEIRLPPKKFETISAVCGSLRLDAVLSGLMNKSRSEVKGLILSGKVAVNHFESQKLDLILAEGDLISVRGFGRAEISDIGAKTRSDRIHMEFKKYI